MRSKGFGYSLPKFIYFLAIKKKAVKWRHWKQSTRTFVFQRQVLCWYKFVQLVKKLLNKNVGIGVYTASSGIIRRLSFNAKFHASISKFGLKDKRMQFVEKLTFSWQTLGIWFLIPTKKIWVFFYWSTEVFRNFLIVSSALFTLCRTSLNFVPCRKLEHWRILLSTHKAERLRWNAKRQELFATKRLACYGCVKHTACALSLLNPSQVLWQIIFYWTWPTGEV